MTMIFHDFPWFSPLAPEPLLMKRQIRAMKKCSGSKTNKQTGEHRKQFYIGYGTTNVGYRTTNADAGVGIGLKRGIQKFDNKILIDW